MRAILRGSEDGKMKIFASLGPIEMIEGDEAVTSGSRFSAPAGIKIGTVKDDAIQTLTDISDILYVSVITVEEEIKRDENSETKK
jgi:cell shape-determining protein MreC